MGRSLSVIASKVILKKENGIEHRRTTPLWPQANGEVGRQNRAILKRLRIAQAEGRDWRSQMDDFLMMYRSTPHSTTGISVRVI